MFIEKVKEFYPEMKAIREDLHRHPELSYQEVRTSAIVIEKLKEYGVDEVEQVWNTGVRAALANGGVLNDHHGVGLKLSRLVREQYGPALQVLQALKEKLDPNGILNPYKMGL